MIHSHSLDELHLQNSWLTIGVFDGVHRGHQKVIRRLMEGAHANGAQAVVVTFWPHPAFVLGGGEVKSLATPDERADLLGSFGVDVVLTHPFDLDVAHQSALEFMTHVKEHIALSHLLMGYDFALGRGREGDATRLAELGREMNFTTEVIEAVSDESGVISSTEIRKLVSVGDVANAAKLLGRNYHMRGPVIHGDGRGGEMNIPTANIDYPREKIMPANGIYASWARVNGQKHRAAVNVGINPTFTPDKQTPNVEAYILDFDQDLYGRDLMIEFVARLRDELKFDSVKKLIEQIQKDIAKVREVLHD
jgi:riboflavin kinase/FMN adenylyltransferase